MAGITAINDLEPAARRPAEALTRLLTGFQPTGDTSQSRLRRPILGFVTMTPDGLDPRADVVAAVRKVFSPLDAEDVIEWLRRLDSDREQVAVVVGATWQGKPSVQKIRLGVETALTDFRDVLMNEYDKRIDYKAELRKLGLERPYPV